MIKQVSSALCAATLILPTAAFAAEQGADVLTRVRAHVAAQWQVLGHGEPSQRIGFHGSFWTDAGNKLAAVCDSGPVGLVTYTRFEGDGTCAVYPYRTSDGTIRARIAMSAPGASIMDHDVEKNGGGSGARTRRGKYLGLLVEPNPENETPEDRLEAVRSKLLADCGPADIVQAITCLDTRWTEESRNQFAGLRARDVIRTHIGFGMWIRNNWGLWAKGPLAEFFLARDVLHPDEMSGVLLNAYWLKLHGCVVNWNDVRAVSARFSQAMNDQPCTIK